MSDLIPPLDTKKQSGRPVRNDTQTKGKSYSIYITPAEKKLLDLLGQRQGGKGLSEGIHYLIKFFSAHVKRNN